jgi:hypothetical protein
MTIAHNRCSVTMASNQAYCLAFLYENTFIASDARSRQRWLILFSLDRYWKMPFNVTPEESSTACCFERILAS